MFETKVLEAFNSPVWSSGVYEPDIQILNNFQNEVGKCWYQNAIINLIFSETFKKRIGQNFNYIC